MIAKIIIAPLSVFLLTACSGVQPHSYCNMNNHNVNAEVLTTRNDLSNIRFIGHGEHHSLVSYSGINADLNFALKNIVPDNWTIKLSDEVYKGVLPKVSWDAGQQWLYVLDKVMKSGNLYAYVDWNKKRADIAINDKLSRPGSIASRATALSVPKATGSSVPKATGLLASKPVTTIVAPVMPQITTAKAAPKGLEQVVANNAAKVPVPTIKVPVQQRRTIERGVNLKDVVVSWAAKEPCAVAGSANWSVIWDTQIIYRVDAPLNFTGTFKDALNSLFTLYGAADTPLYAGIKTSQCLVKVSDKEPL